MRWVELNRDCGPWMHVQIPLRQKKSKGMERKERWRASIISGDLSLLSRRITVLYYKFINMKRDSLE